LEFERWCFLIFDACQLEFTLMVVLPPAKRKSFGRPASGLRVPPPTPPVGPPTLLSVTLIDGATVRLTFSAPVAVDPDPGPLDGYFNLAGQSPSAAASAGPALVNVTFPSGAGEGDEWYLDAQPNWLVTVVATPAAGFVE
jgi:hypothetical protein